MSSRDFLSIGVALAGLSGVFLFIGWFLMSTSKVFDGLTRYLTNSYKPGLLRKIAEACQVNDMSIKNALSCYVDGRALVLCHEPLPFGIGRRCWRIPIAEIKPRDDAVYDFAITTPKGPLLCYFGPAFRRDYKLFV